LILLVIHYNCIDRDLIIPSHICDPFKCWGVAEQACREGSAQKASSCKGLSRLHPLTRQNRVFSSSHSFPLWVIQVG